VKYDILNKIAAANRVPTTHSSYLATWLGMISSGSKLLEFSYSMSCTVMVYTPEGFMLAYFVAKKGEKNGLCRCCHGCCNISLLLMMI